MEPSNEPTPINNQLVTYLNNAIAGENPQNLHAVVCLYDGQEPRVYYRPDGSSGEVVFNDPLTKMPNALLRVDTVTSLAYSTNSTCRIVIINGAARMICS